MIVTTAGALRLLPKIERGLDTKLAHEALSEHRFFILPYFDVEIW